MFIYTPTFTNNQNLIKVCIIWWIDFFLNLITKKEFKRLGIDFFLVPDVGHFLSNYNGVIIEISNSDLTNFSEHKLVKLVKVI